MGERMVDVARALRKAAEAKGFEVKDVKSDDGRYREMTVRPPIRTSWAYAMVQMWREAGVVKMEWTLRTDDDKRGWSSDQHAVAKWIEAYEVPARLMEAVQVA
jgi:hypothetical protein